MTVGFDDLRQRTRATRLGCRKPVRHGGRNSSAASQRVGARDADNGAVRARRRRPERVVLALDDQRRDVDGVELREAALLGVARWVEWEREADDGDRVGLGCRAARDAGARRAAASQDREAAERTLA